MPYKNPERKRQWEREHREIRNTTRRMQRLNARKPAPDPGSDQKPKDTWKTILGWAIEIGVVLLAAIAGVSLPSPADLGGSPGQANPGGM